MFGLAWPALLLTLQLAHLVLHQASIETNWFFVDEPNRMRSDLFLGVVLPFLEQIGIVCHFPLTAEEGVVVLILVSLEVHSAHDHRVLRAEEQLRGVGEDLRVL